MPFARLSVVSLLVVVALALASLPAFATDAVRILGLQPTVLFPNAEPLRQVSWLSVENTSPSALACELTVSVNGVPTGAPQALVVPPGVSQQNALVPDLAATTEIAVELRVRDTVLARHTQRWEPQRKWKVFVVKSSHEDIGYEDFLWMKQKEIADFIELGRRLSMPSGVTADSGPRLEGGYRYWLETLLFPRYYAEERSEVALRELIENAVKPGFLPLAGAPNGLHTHWMDYEELARMTYPGRRDMKDRFGLDLDTFAIVDNPSFSWSSVQALAGAGYKYAVRFGQSWRTGGNNNYETTKLPPVFWWEGPDARSRILYAWRSHYRIHFWFGQSDRAAADLAGLGAQSVNQELMAVQNGKALGPYPWNALLVPSYRDHETPAWDNRALAQWRATYRYPDLRIADPRDFMVEMERAHGADLPVLRGDLNNFSADYATIDPHSQGQKRRAARLLPLAEGLAAVASLRQSDFSLGPPEVDRAYRRMFDYAEHSWPTKPPARDIHQFNAQWGKLLEGERALADAERLFDRSLQALAAQIPTGTSRELVVVNPLAHARTDLVLSRDLPGVPLDPVDGAPLPTQTLSDGRTAFVARDIPAFGYKTFKLAPPTAPAPAAPRATGTTLENEFYRLTFDPASGAVTSIRDRELNRELLDPAAPYQFNQLVWVSKKTGESKEGANYAPRNGAKLTARAGPVAAEMIATITDAKLGGATITQTVRLYAGVKRIDVVNELRHVGVLSSPRSSDRYRENIFYAFPFQVENFTPRAEYAGGVVRPYDDQLRWGSHDFLNANRWVDVSNPAWGVTMAVHNAPIVHFGEIRYNELSVDYRPSKSHLYGFVWSNRMDGLATLCPDDMNARVAYSFTSHAGDWNSGAASALGWSIASPLEVKVLPTGQRGPLPAQKASFLAVDAPNVQVTVLKESAQPGRGWIVRLVETAGVATNASLAVARFPVTSATLCDLVENDRQPLVLRDGRIALSLPAFGVATVRLHAKTAPAPVGAVEIVARGDDRIQLRWPAVADAASYHIFRSVDPNDPPTGQTLVGRTTQTEFTDLGLNLDTTYSYRVAAVATGNTQGAPSERIEARTSAKNLSPPSPVPELGIVRQSADRLMVCWRKAPESDVARYFVFRSERPDTPLSQLQPIAEVKPGGFYLEHYMDRGLAPGTAYYYRVVAEDWASHRQTSSPSATGTTPKISP